MLVLFKYKIANKKGIITKYVKQVYNIDIYGDVINIGGNGEKGYRMYFWPEGDLSNEVITEKLTNDVSIGHEIDTDRALIYKIS